MIYIAIYLAIGVALSLYLPVAQRRAVAQFQYVIGPSELARMQPDDRARFLSMMESMRATLPTWVYVAGCVVWPLLALALIYGHVFGVRLVKQISGE